MRQQGACVKARALNPVFTMPVQGARKRGGDGRVDQKLDGIRAELSLRIAALDAAHGQVRQFASDLDQVRRIALAAGMLPAVTVAHALESALARGERGPVINGWLDILRDAISCEAADAATCEAFAAAGSVRYN